MKINSVSLTNYRNHSNIKVEFTEGINLLLGKNGAGKTSILEALGVAMFDGGLRAGNKQEDAIKKDEKYALIKVEFIGNDELEYYVEKKIGTSGFHKLFLKGEKTPRYSDAKAVKNKIKELAGISPTADLPSIFRSVITARQNEITEIFAANPAERQKVFNAIFETDIYGEMYSGFTKKCLDIYNGKLDVINDRINEYSSKIKDSDILLDEFKELDFALKIKGDKINELKAGRDLALSLKNSLMELKSKINEKRENISGNKNLLNAKNSELSNENDNLAKAAVSAELVDRNSKAYNEYIQKTTELSEFNIIISKLEKKDSEKRKIEKQLSELELAIASMKTDLESKSNFKIEKQDKIVELTDNINLPKDIIKAEEITLNNYLNQYSSLELVKKEYLNLLQDITVIESEISNQNTLINEKEKSLIDKVIIDENLIEINEKITSLSGLIDQKKLYVNDLSKFSALLDENNKAAKELKNGLCPLLKENCLNINTETQGENYFEKRKHELSEIIDSLQLKISELDNVEKELKTEEKNKTIIENKIKDSDKAQIDITQIKDKILLNQKDIENKLLNIRIIFQNYPEYSRYTGAEDNKDLQIKLQSDLSEISSKIASSKTIIEHNEKRILELKSEIKKIEKELTKLSNEIEDLNSKIETYDKNINEFLETINKLSGEIEKLDESKVNREEINKKIEELSPKYKIYVENEKSAANLKNIELRITRLTKEAYEVGELIEKTEKELNEIESSYSQEKYDENEIKLKSLNEEFEQVNDEYGSLGTKMALKKKEIEDNEFNINKVAGEQKDKEILSKKIEIAGFVRNKLNQMGKLIASRALTKLQYAATENYRNISGKTEHILWKNDDGDSYQVYLSLDSEGADSRKFEQLSGGEQVAVALSLRAALSSMTTKGRFAIFDEPTVNLDVERRAALAESLDKILRDLRQAIIVTHDDSFKEMANSTIDLSK